MNRRDWLNRTSIATTGLLLSPYFSKLFAQSRADLVISPEWQGQGTPLKHSWEGLGNVDQMRWMIRRDMQDQLRMAAAEINLRHIRAVGLFDDELRVIGRDPSAFFDKIRRKKKRINWQITDYLFDSLLDMGINPVITTTFMPTELASGVETTFETKSNITPPKDYKAWEALLRDFMLHYKDRYGEAVVKNWYYETWNEPNLGGFWTGGKEGYFKLYEITTKTLKDIVPDIKMGGPSTARAEWIADLLDFGAAHDCTPDYIIGHCYNNDSAAAPLSPFEGPQADKENDSPNFTAGVVRGVDKVLRDYDYQGEVHWNEWGLSWHPYAPVRESANEAAFAVKTMKEVSQLGDYFAYWCLSDIYDQVGYNREAFAGHYGMINLYGLRKPIYQAHQLLTKMGDTELRFASEGTNDSLNALVSKNKNEYQVLVYCFNMAYKVDQPTRKRKVVVGLPYRAALNDLRLYRISDQENNILHDWAQMGKPPYLKPGEIDYLKEKNELTASQQGIELLTEGGEPAVAFDVSYPGVALLTIQNNAS